MVGDVETPLAARRSRSAARARPLGRSWRGRVALAATMVAALAALAGCSSTLKDTPAANVAAADPPTSGPPNGCSIAVLDTLSSVLRRVYHEGVSSERTASARYLITN